MAVAGQTIAAVCEGNTVNVYDSATGVLKLSLKTPHAVTKFVGSPDGSVLFCSHEHFRTITLWDTQTGGLIHTFTTEYAVNDITISSTGKYLGSCSFNGTFMFWEVENRCGRSHFLGKPIVCICWLEPEDQIALAFEHTVAILEITTGRTLHTFHVGGSVREIMFSAGQYRLAVWSTTISSPITAYRSRTSTLVIPAANFSSPAITAQSTITVIDIRAGLELVSIPHPKTISSFTFSDDGDRVICAIPGSLESFDISRSPPEWDDYSNILGMTYSIGLLQSGRLVVNVGEYIQLLVKQSTSPFGTCRGPKISNVYPLDNGRAICAVSRNHEDVYLLDMETMKTLYEYHAGLDIPHLNTLPQIVCASVDKRIVVLCLPANWESTLELHIIGSVFPQWEQRLSLPVSLGALSPDGEKLITIMHAAGWGEECELCIRGVQKGEILTSVTLAGALPRDITFTSETQFYIEDPSSRALSGSEDDCGGDVNYGFRYEMDYEEYNVRRTFTLAPTSNGYGIQQVSGEGVLSTRPDYALDKNLEWVVDAKSRRICWLPPGYIGGIGDGYLFVGSSIVMVGQDGTVRRLTFRDPYSES